MACCYYVVWLGVIHRWIVPVVFLGGRAQDVERVSENSDEIENNGGLVSDFRCVFADTRVSFSPHSQDGILG